MKGSIRAGLGFLCVYGSVGALDHDPSASIVVSTVVAVVGILCMYSGVSAMKEQV